MVTVKTQVKQKDARLSSGNENSSLAFWKWAFAGKKNRPALVVWVSEGTGKGRGESVSQERFIARGQSLAQDRSVSRAISQSALIIRAPPRYRVDRAGTRTREKWEEKIKECVCVCVCVCYAFYTHRAGEHPPNPPPFKWKRTNTNQAVKGFFLSLNKLNADFCFKCGTPFVQARNMLLYCPDVISFKDNSAGEWNGRGRLEGDFFYIKKITTKWMKIIYFLSRGRRFCLSLSMHAPPNSMKACEM